MIERVMTIGALAARSRCSVDTIRYYERVGLMPEVPRTEGGQRLYNEQHARRLGFIRRSRDLGLGLAQIRDMLDALERDRADCGKTRALLEERAAAVQARIAEFQALERNLRAAAAACGDETAARCRVLAAMFVDKDLAPGFRCCS
jgi:MerR family transcriptional regulator, mercuric resistance operon regulatory protein